MKKPKLPRWLDLFSFRVGRWVKPKLRWIAILLGLPAIYWASILLLDGLLTRYPEAYLPLAYCCAALVHMVVWWQEASAEDKKRGWVYVHRWTYGLVL